MASDFRRRRIAWLVALAPFVLATFEAAHAQQHAAVPGNAAAARPDDKQGLGPTEQDQAAVMDDNAARMRGAPEENTLLGAPAPYRDIYRSQFENDSVGLRQSNLMHAEDVPMDAPAAKAKPGANEAAIENAPALKVAPPAQLQPPAQAAKSVYRDSADPVNPVKQQPIYRSPW